MSLPRNTKLTLKQIVENMNAIPDKMGQKKQTLTPEQKRQLKEMALMFNEYGSHFQDEQKLMDSVSAIAEFMKLAESYAMNECGDVFQENIMKQNFQDAGKKLQQLQKLAQECYVRKQQLGVLFDDIRHYVTRYYKVAEPISTKNTKA
jgi:hypothetical protein